MGNILISNHPQKEGGVVVFHLEFCGDKASGVYTVWLVGSRKLGIWLSGFFIVSFIIPLLLDFFSQPGFPYFGETAKTIYPGFINWDIFGLFFTPSPPPLFFFLVTKER